MAKVRWYLSQRVMNFGTFSHASRTSHTRLNFHCIQADPLRVLMVCLQMGCRKRGSISRVAQIRATFAINGRNESIVCAPVWRSIEREMTLKLDIQGNLWIGIWRQSLLDVSPNIPSPLWGNDFQYEDSKLTVKFTRENLCLFFFFLSTIIKAFPR